MGKPAVFLDRDHTVIEDPGYLSNAGAVKLLPGVEHAIRSLAQAGYKIVVVTNQSGVARGMLSEETLDVIHAEMRRQLAAGGAHVDAVYHCPYHPDGNVEQYAIESDMRKPRPGMLLKAAEDMDIDLAESWMVGDSARDVEAGQRAGCRTIRLRTHHTSAPGEATNDGVQADFSVRTLPEAAKIILRPPPSHGPVRPGKAAAAEARADQDHESLAVMLQQLSRMAPRARGPAKTAGMVVQAFAVPVLIGALVALAASETIMAAVLALVALTLQVMALTFFTIHRGG